MERGASKNAAVECSHRPFGVIRSRELNETDMKYRPRGPKGIYPRLFDLHAYHWAIAARKACEVSGADARCQVLHANCTRRLFRCAEAAGAEASKARHLRNNESTGRAEQH